MTRSLERHIRNLDFLRPRTRGKFLFAGEEKLYVRGVTYGRFRPGEGGGEYHGPEAVERDFAQMAANGLNAVRTYTTPERWLLDAAQRHGFRVMVGLSWWEQHLASLNHNRRVESIKEHVRAGVSASAGISASRTVIDALNRRWLPGSVRRSAFHGRVALAPRLGDRLHLQWRAHLGVLECALA